MRVASRAFAGPAEFRAWLAKNHATAQELFVRCSKAHVAGGLTYRQALDEALCIGWIDGVRHSVDEASFSVRFTPRKPRSAWSTQPETRERRLGVLIARSERREGIPALKRPTPGKTGHHKEHEAR